MAHVRLHFVLSDLDLAGVFFSSNISFPFKCPCAKHCQDCGLSQGGECKQRSLWFNPPLISACHGQNSKHEMLIKNSPWHAAWILRTMWQSNLIENIWSTCQFCFLFLFHAFFYSFHNRPCLSLVSVHFHHLLQRDEEKKKREKKRPKLSAVPCSSGSHHGSMSDCHLQAMNRTARQAGAQICVSGTRHLSTERHSSSGNAAWAKTVMNRKCGIQAGDVKRHENTSAAARTWSIKSPLWNLYPALMPFHYK